MKIAVSTLNLKSPQSEELLKIDNLDIDYIHVDVMDGLFVENKTEGIEYFYDITRLTTHPKDVHLMVSDIKKYIDDFSTLHPEFISFHYEASSDIVNIINYIHNKGIKASLAINPSTQVSEIINYLEYLDMVLIMSVDPGRGGQTFIDSVLTKVEQLKLFRENNNYNYLIEIDGGVNNETIKKCSDVDICVVGSYITKNNYEEAVKNLRD